MNLLIIEDEPGFIQKMQAACENTPVTLLTADSASLRSLRFDAGIPVEEQLAKQLAAIVEEHKINLVLLDTDLSREQNSLRTQVEYRAAFQEIGTPVCRYRKGHSQTKFAALEELRRIAQDGASAIWVPKALTDGDAKDLPLWLEKIASGFAQLTQTLNSDPELLKSPSGPSGILARALERESLRSDLLGYTSQNSFFFASSSQRSSQQWATQLGYWLFNYILTFPGPLLNPVAAAAFLNLTPNCFETAQVKYLTRAAAYKGPFSALDFYWRDDLATLLDQWDGDIAGAPELQNMQLERVDPDAPGRSAYFCVLDKAAIKESDAAEVNPDWIPPGAQLSRIRESELDELGPMLKA